MTDRDEQRQHWAAEKKWLGAIFTILVTYGVGGIWWAGTLTNQVQYIAERQVEDRARITETRGQVQAMRVSEGRLEQRLTNIEASTARVERLMEDIARQMRDRP